MRGASASPGEPGGKSGRGKRETARPRLAPGHGRRWLRPRPAHNRTTKIEEDHPVDRKTGLPNPKVCSFMFSLFFFLGFFSWFFLVTPHTPHTLTALLTNTDPRVGQCKTSYRMPRGGDVPRRVRGELVSLRRETRRSGAGFGFVYSRHREAMALCIHTLRHQEHSFNGGVGGIAGAFRFAIFVVFGADSGGKSIFFG